MTGMNEEREIKSEAALRALFEQASPRLQPPSTDEQEIREAVHAEWLKMNRQRRRGKQAVYWAMAASLVLVGFLTLYTPQSPAPFVTVASIEKSIGEIAVRQNDSNNMIRIGSQVRNLSSGQTIVTGVSSAIALNWSAGGSLRLDEETELVFISPTEIKLLAGQIYFDSGLDAEPRTGESFLTVTTQAGVVRHVGTQFMAKVADNSLTVNVREGVVSIDGKDYAGSAMAGQQVVLKAGSLHSKEVRDGYGAEWRWAQLVAPPLNLDGRKINDLLEWVSREIGRPLNYESQSARILADGALQGVVNVEPMRALKTYLQVTDLRWELVNDEISIRAAPVGE